MTQIDTVICIEPERVSEQNYNPSAVISWEGALPLSIGTYQSQPLAFYTANAQRMVILNNGNVGIGTTSPNATLSVDGTVEMFGAWESKSIATTYQAASDGMVVAQAPGAYHTAGYMLGYTDSNNPPTTIRARNGSGYVDVGGGASITMPVRKGDYWKVTKGGTGLGTPNVYWIPLG